MMKKICILFVIIACLSFIACGKDSSEAPVSNEKATSEKDIEEYMVVADEQEDGIDEKDLNVVLNRSIFLFKDSTPELYTDIVRGIEEYKHYKENWKFKDILNSDYFKDGSMTWQYIEKDSAIGTVVLFKGFSTNMDADIALEFAINGDKCSLIRFDYPSANDKHMKMDALEDLTKKGTEKDPIVVLGSYDVTISLVSSFMIMGIDEDVDTSKTGETDNSFLFDEGVEFIVDSLSGRGNYISEDGTTIIKIGNGYFTNDGDYTFTIDVVGHYTCGITDCKIVTDENGIRKFIAYIDNRIDSVKVYVTFCENDDRLFVETVEPKAKKQHVYNGYYYNEQEYKGVEEEVPQIPYVNYTFKGLVDGYFYPDQNDCFEILEPPMDYTSGYGLDYNGELKYYFVNNGKEIYGIDASNKIYTLSKNLFSPDYVLGELVQQFGLTMNPYIVDIKEKPEGCYSGQYNIWEINNGYMIIHTMNNRGMASAEVLDYSIISDAKYNSLIPIDGRSNNSSEVEAKYEKLFSINGDMNNSEDDGINDSEYIFPNSDKEYLTDEDFVNLSPEEYRLARNEIYARHGRIFKDEGLREYFESKSWYNPTVPADDFSEEILNEYELSNQKMIQKYEGR